MFLFYDCETSGLPNWRLSASDPSQPHIIQLAAILTDDQFNEVSCLNVLIEPDGWTIPQAVTDLTGITNLQAVSWGVPAALALRTFLALHAKATMRVAHNEDFDSFLVRIQMARHGWDEPAQEQWRGDPNAFCTMKAATPICNLPPTDRMVAAGFTKPKPPKLTEAHEHFFGCVFDNAHNALADVRACMAVFRCLQESEETEI